jgi:hypothetical protein
VNATQFEIYFKDPFLAYIYLAFAISYIRGICRALECQPGDILECEEQQKAVMI